MPQPDFTLASSYTVVRAFRFAGKDYKPGQVFDWRKIACDQRKLRALYSAKKIALPETGELVDPATVEPTAPAPAPEIDAAETPPETTEDAPEATDGPQAADDAADTGDAPAVPVDEFKFNPDTMKIAHRGRGAWFVMSKDGDEKLFGPITQEQAQEIARSPE